MKIKLIYSLIHYNLQEYKDVPHNEPDKTKQELRTKFYAYTEDMQKKMIANPTQKSFWESVEDVANRFLASIETEVYDIKLASAGSTDDPYEVIMVLYGD